MAKFYYETDLCEMPENCLECMVDFCRIPLKKDGFTIKKGYDSRRHPKCPLRKISDKDLEEKQDQCAAGPNSRTATEGSALDYSELVSKLNNERAACQYAYGEMIPAYYSQALIRAIENIKECEKREAEATKAARELRKRGKSNEQH